MHNFKEPSSLKVFGIGPPRTGTHYLSSAFPSSITSAHEPNAIYLIRLLRAYQDEGLSYHKFRESFLSIIYSQNIQINISHVNYFFLNIILEDIPDARFILTVRNPEHWLRSFINHSVLFKDAVQDEWEWLKRFRFNLDRWPHSQYEKVLKSNELFSIDSYLAFYSENIHNVIKNVPKERLLIIPTEDIDKAGGSILSFMDLTASAFQPKSNNRNEFEHKSKFIEEVEPEFFQERLAYHCGWIDPWLKQNTSISNRSAHSNNSNDFIGLKRDVWNLSKKPDIAIIQATPPGFNPGMLVSEMMAKRFVERHNLQDRVKFYQIMSLGERLGNESQAKETLARCNVGIQYETLQSTNQLTNMQPIYWGDFLHMAQYVRNIQPILNAAGNLRMADGGKMPETAVQLLMLSGAPKKLLSKVISFGTTLAFNTQEDLQDTNYGMALSTLASQAKLFMVRDMVSASNLAIYSGSQNNVCVGIDATQLLALDNDTQKYSENIIKGNGLVFFGRGSQHPEHLKSLLHNIEQSLNFQFEWLDWGDRAAFPFLDKFQFIRDIFNYEESRVAPELSEIFSKILKAKVIVTDTYHLSVIAWSLGIPVICIPGEIEGQGLRDVNLGHRYSPIDKRRIFFYQNNLSQYYLENLESISKNDSAQFELLIKDIRQGHTLRQFSLHNSVAAARSEAALLKAIN